jgi:hypothetical protein
MIQQVANGIDEIKCSWSYNFCRCSPVTLKPTYRGPPKTAPTSMALSYGPVHKSQHCTKGSTQGNGGLVLSRQHLHQMEVYWWIPLVDLR